MTEQQTAAEIYQDSLDNIAHAITAGDLLRAQDLFCFPHRIKTLTLDLTINTIEDFEKSTTRFMENLRQEGVTRTIRIVKKATFESESEIIGEHETHRFHGATWRVTPYRNRNRLRLGSDGKWRVTHIAAAIHNRAGHVELVQPPQNPAEVPSFDDE